MKNIAVVTGARSEYGLLKPLLKGITDSSELDLKLIVTGMHLLTEYGLTINEIKQENMIIDAKVPMYTAPETDDTRYGKALAIGIEGITRSLRKIRPDILIVTGDRLEPMAATMAAATLSIPIAHVHGGEKTDSGHIDEAIRHSITRFSHIHFTATQQSAERLTKMGEEPRRIHNVGALSLDSLINLKPLSKEKLAANLDLNPKQKIIITIFHSVHLEKEDVGRQAREIIEAVKNIEIQTVIVYPNNDSGSADIITEIEKCRNMPFIKIHPSLPYFEYVNLLRHADVLIGNSSSGIIEAPSFGLPVVHIGSRNVGREHSENIIFVEADREEIVRAIEKALYDEGYKEKVKRCRNPYGDGKASDRIIKILKELSIDDKLMRKRVTY